jgi:hypothetical protein
LGVAIAVGGVGLLTSLAERYSPRASEIRLDGVVLVFTLALSALVALLLSFLASLPKEGGVASWILAGGHRTSGSVAKHRLQRGLVVVQVAVSVVLLAGAGLLNRTMMRLADVHTGLETEEVLTMQVSLLAFAEFGVPGAVPAANERYELIRTEIAALPGVIGAWGPPRHCATRASASTSKPKANRLPRVKRCRPPSCAPPTRCFSKRPGFRCSWGARSRRPMGPARGQS